MFLYNNAVVDINLPIEINGTRYPNLLDPEIRAALGVVETQDTIDVAKQKKLAELSANRYNKEVAGIDVGGSIIASDRESQATLSGAVLTVMRYPDTLIDWKSDNGWIQINKAQVEAIADLVSAHVQGCFSIERTKSEQLLALNSIEAVANFDTSF